MRMEASQEATNNDASAHSAVNLANPLIESTANPESQAQPFAQSFNYYTDPMAAYSGNKQRSKVTSQISQDYSSTPTRPWSNETFPSPSLQSHINYSPNQRMQQPQGQYSNASHYTPNALQGGNFPNPNHNFQGRGWNTNSPRPGGYRGPGNFGYRSPQHHFTSGPGQGGYASPGPGSSPSPRFSPDHGSGRGYPGPQPHFRNNPNYGSSQGGYPGSGSNQGRGQWSGNSMSSGASYGRGRGGGRGQGQGQGGGHNHVSAEERPDMFYNNSMVEDPWKFLEPVIWIPHKKQWFPPSVSAKKPRVSESPRQRQQSSSEPSLAEMLAASYNEAVNEEPSAG